MAPTLIQVRVIPRARRTEISGRRGAAILIRLAAPPVDGAANDALIAYLAERLGLPQRRITIARGGSGRDKTLAVDGLTSADVARRLGLDGEITG